MSDIIVNKVIKGDETYLDLTSDTVTEGTLLKNRTAHNSEGVQILGAMEEGGGSVTGVKGDKESAYRDGNVNLTAANIGTYTDSQIDARLNGKVDVHGSDSLMTNAERVKLAGIEAEAEKNVIESVTLNGFQVIPVDKTIALDVIDKDVDNLTNYYKKSEIDVSLGAKQNRVLASTLNIGGQTIGNVEGALSALNESKSDLVNGKVPVNELPVYQPVIGSIQSIGGIVPPSSSGDEDKYLRSDGTWAKPAGGGGGVTDYDDLTNRPKINGTTLSEDKTGTQLGLQNIVLASALTIGGQEITEVEPALRALNEKGGGHTILDEDGTTYPQRNKLQFEGCEITDDAVNGITVVKCEGGEIAIVDVPTVINTELIYDGTTKSPTITRDTAHTTITGTTEATEFGSYSFTISLSKPSYMWTDNTTAPKTYIWGIEYDGSTIAPVNDIQTWLKCAMITDKSYTTLNEVLADSTTLAALMLNHNAVDYLVRSTSWVSNITGNQTAMTDIGASDYCANTLLADSTWITAICDSAYFESVLNVKVPTMTSNTTPSGVVSGSSKFNDNVYQYYYAFDNNNNTRWASASGTNGSNSVHYIQYQFTEQIKPYKIQINYYSEASEATRNYVKKVDIQGANNGAFQTIQTFTNNVPDEYTKLYTIIAPQSDKYDKIKIQFTGYNFNASAAGLTYGVMITELKIYGRA